MKFLNLASALLLLPAQALAGQYKGFSIGANKANGECKTTADWKADFQAIKGWGKGFNAIHTYACSDCNSKLPNHRLAIETFPLLTHHNSISKSCSSRQGNWPENSGRRLGHRRCPLRSREGCPPAGNQDPRHRLDCSHQCWL